MALIQLSFQPALDPFHTMFRMLRLRPILRATGALPVDQVRILDFYLAFPLRIANLRPMKRHMGLKAAALKVERPKPYGDQPDDKIVLARMEPIQEVALQTLSSHALIDGAQLDRGLVQVAEAPISSDLAARVEDANARDERLLTLLGALATEYSFSGADGLKQRSGLLEHRYDAA